MIDLEIRAQISSHDARDAITQPDPVLMLLVAVYSVAESRTSFVPILEPNRIR